MAYVPARLRAASAILPVHRAPIQMGTCGFLDGVGGEGEVLELVVVAGMGDGPFGEESIEDFEAFVGDSAPLSEVGDSFDLQVLGNDSPESQAENQPTVG